MPTKLEAITQAQNATEASLQAVIDYLRTATSPTSEEAHAIIDRVLAKHDCESPEGHIVSCGLDSAQPHEKGRGPIRPHEPIVIDIYPRSKETGYYADMTRTVCIGTPSPELQKMYDAVLNALALGVSLVKPGMSCKKLHESIAEYFKSEGYETSGRGKEFAYAEGFVHGLGHGVGKDIHEAPHISRKSTQTLHEGDIITIEPGLYYKHLGGVRLEDLLLVTAHGAQVITNFPKQLAI